MNWMRFPLGEEQIVFMSVEELVAHERGRSEEREVRRKEQEPVWTPIPPG
jgi:hypothetical protein